MIGRSAKLAAAGYAITLFFLLALVVTSSAVVTRVREAEATAYRHALDNATIERIRCLFEKKVATDRALLLAGRPEADRTGARPHCHNVRRLGSACKSIPALRNCCRPRARRSLS